MKEYKIGTPFKEEFRKEHRKVWVTLTEDEQGSILDKVVELYDGTRTLSACWIEAFSELDQNQ